MVLSSNLFAQSINNFDFENLKAQDLSDNQISQIYERAKQQGLSVQELEVLAITRGMSPFEASKLKNRLNTIQNLGSEDPNTDGDSSPLDLKSVESPNKIDTLEFNKISNIDTTIFGSELFTNRDLSFEPSQNIPTPKNYTLGAGDEIIIDIYGATENNYSLTISSEGFIQVSNIGPIFLNGLTIEEATKRIKSKLSTIYSGLRSNNPDTFVQVSLGALRTIKVHILGQANLPGTYNLSSLSSVFNALYVSGGPSKNGTFRSIKVIRNGSVFSELDLYSFIVNGETNGNVVLQDQDIIKIDPYINRISVQGEAKREGLFETKPNETFEDLLNYAGGFNQYAYTKRITLHRNTATQKSIVEIKYPEDGNTTLKSGDKIYIGRILERYDNRVVLEGAVYREGDYQLEQNKTLYLLIQNADGLMGDAYLERAIIYRTNPDLTVKAIPVNLGAILNDPTNNDVKLVKDDIVKISSIFDLREDKTVTIEGEVITGGTFPFIEDMSIQDLIYQANGFTNAASNYNIEIARRVLDDGSGMVRNELAEVFQVSVRDGLILNKSDQEFKLEEYDQVFVRSSPTYETQQNVSIKGQVVYPGTYTLKNRNFKISDLVKASGGITKFAYTKGAQLNRPSIKDSTSIVAIDLNEILADPGSEKDLLLQPSDVLTIPKRLETVLVDGQVFAPSNIRFDDSKSFRSYINSAGGATDSANTKKSYIIYANGEVKRMKRFLFFKKYPKVEPGSKIIVPQKPFVDKISTSERIAIYSTIVSIAAIVTNTIFQIRNN
jgi:protein involved in polysaccharide export with SLBB domain